MDAPDPYTLTLVPEDGPAQEIRPLAQPASKMTPADVETQLRQPSGKLNFRLGVQIPENPDDIKPHKDAPAFHQFAHAVLADAALREYSVQLAYLGSDAVAEALLIGGLVAPPDVQFVLPSEEDAKALAEVLLRYVSKTCRRS